MLAQCLATEGGGGAAGEPTTLAKPYRSAAAVGVGPRPDGWCDYFSTQWTNYTGVGESDLLGWRWMEALHPDDREPTRQFWTESVAGRQPYDVEYRVRRSDGTYGWFKTRGTPIRDSDGTIVKWFGTCTDITDRKRAEQALKDQELELRQARDVEIKVMERTKELRRNEAYLAEAQKLSKTGSFGWNVFGGEIYWSEETFRIFEYGRETKPGIELILERTHPEDRVRVQQAIDRASPATQNWVRCRTPIVCLTDPVKHVVYAQGIFWRQRRSRAKPNWSERSPTLPNANARKPPCGRPRHI